MSRSSRWALLLATPVCGLSICGLSACEPSTPRDAPDAAGLDAARGELDARGDVGVERADGGGPDARASDAATCTAPPRAALRLALDEGAGQVLDAQAASSARGIWEHMYGVPTDPDAGLAEIRARLDRMRASGIDAVSLLVSSRYLDAVLDPEGHGALEPHAAWDMVGRYVDEARARGMETRLWFAPMILKEDTRANELVEHPEWALASFDLMVPAAVDLASDEARAYEVGLLRAMAARYHPDVIELEEPYYHDLDASSLVPTDAPFAARFHTRFGYWPTTSRPTRPADVATLKREVLGQFFAEARAAIHEADANVDFALNVQTLYGSTPSFASKGLDLARVPEHFDVFFPQLYFGDAARFDAELASDETLLGGRVSVVAGVTAHLDGAASPVARAQLASAERTSRVSAGSSLFAFLYLGELAEPLPSVAPLVGRLGASASADESDPSWLDDPERGTVLSFRGGTERVVLPRAYVEDDRGASTLSVWVHLTPGVRARWETLLSRGAQSSELGFSWIYLADGHLVTQHADGTAYVALASDPVTLDDDRWHHVAVVHDRGAQEARFYVDGAPRGSAAMPLPMRSSTRGELVVGNYAPRPGDTYGLRGALSDLRWFRGALDEGAIAALACGAPG